MRITKFGHACVRIESDGTTVVIDPGGFTEPEAVDGADAVLITHEHADHWTPEMLRATSAPVFTIGAVARQIREQAPEVAERTTVVDPGESFTAAGVAVSVLNEKHAIIHPELPHFDNSGYLLEVEGQRLFHPGDALDGPGREIDLLMLPVSAPWARSMDLIEFARSVGAPRNLAVHDAIYSEIGSAVFDKQVVPFLEKDGLSYTRLASGQDL
ncbi:MBL fold metallo-hydrolase [Nocardioides insulae]|uniref:MBL fold metallo-hydrolase n=1 Tax=Nocardioides insulae TaxID=394734 RepID=UPI00042228D1|nr:MBL fold metallo-hydrolase [Nocardioides insulae]